MGKKNKKKIQSFQQANSAMGRSHDFTVFELAFLKADVMKRHGKVNNQISLASTAGAVMTTKTPDAANKQYSLPP